MRRFAGIALLVAAAVSCSSGSKGSGSGSTDTVPLMAGFNPGPAPDPSKGFQIILPAVNDIPAGSSQEYCTDTSYIVPQDVWVNGSEGFQTETGHHVIFFYTMSPVAPDTHICASDEMGEFQFGMPASQASAGDGVFTLPSNLAVKLPAGAQIIVNHHYLNAGTTDVAQAQSSINVYYADPTVPHTTSSVAVVLDTQLTVPTGASTYSVDCTINQSYASWMEIPHMHNWGTHITVTDTPVATGVPQQLFDLDWQPDYAFDFNSVATSQDPSTPFMYSAGDKIHIQCDYMNNTGAAMSFGDEMCLLVNFTVDPNNVGNVECDRGVWGTF